MASESLAIYIQPSEPNDDSWCSWAKIPYEGDQSLAALHDRVKMTFSPILERHRQSIIQIDTRHNSGSEHMGVEVFYRSPAIVSLIHRAIAETMYAPKHHAELVAKSDYYIPGCQLDKNGSIIYPEED